MAESAKNVVQSAAKVFAVLRAFDAEHPELTITEVAGRAGLDRGTAFRLIHTLIALGYLAGVPASRRFRLTLRCLELGFAALNRAGLKGQAAPLLRELVPDHADAASLGVLDGADVVYVERVQHELPSGLDRRTGSRTGAYSAALGHAMLAQLPTLQQREILTQSNRIKLSERTLDHHRAIVSLMEELEAVDWYDQRVDATTDPELAAILAHNRDEEKEHAAMTLEWLRRRDPVLDEARLSRTALAAGPPVGIHNGPRTGNGHQCSPAAQWPQPAAPVFRPARTGPALPPAPTPAKPAAVQPWRPSISSRSSQRLMWSSAKGSDMRTQRTPGATASERPRSGNCVAKG